jgi:taurine dioxygenase|tara:strand:+ start:835 stop:1626 length:792 start_codon:yes stop_codon:yes gene_type:complete
MHLKKLGPVGAQVDGIALHSVLEDPGTLSDLKKAFIDNSVLVFKNQNLNPSDLLKVAEIIGRPLKHPIFPGLPDFPEIIKIENLGEMYHTNAHWHSDVTFEEEPPDATFLYSLEVPDTGGDTLFSNQFLAHESLPEDLKSLLSDKKAIHSNASILSLIGADISNAKRVLHPIFRTHPDNGRKALFVTQAFVENIEGLGEKKSEDTLAILYSAACKEEFIYRHKWSKGDLLIWDNRSVQHFAEHGYGDKVRTMHRITTSGSKPF